MINEFIVNQLKITYYIDVLYCSGIILWTNFAYLWNVKFLLSIPYCLRKIVFIGTIIILRFSYFQQRPKDGVESGLFCNIFLIFCYKQGLSICFFFNNEQKMALIAFYLLFTLLSIGSTYSIKQCHKH